MNSHKFSILEQHLNAIETILADSFPKTLNTVEDLLASKFVDKAIQDTVAALESRLERLQRLRTQQADARRLKTAEAREALAAVESAVAPSAKSETKLDKTDKMQIMGFSVSLPRCERPDQIPVGTYAEYRGLCVFRFSKNDYVSCTGLNVGDESRSLSCSRYPCPYGDRCRFFHDPLIWPDSKSTQCVPKSPLVKKCPAFGNVADIKEQFRVLNFQDLRTFARYIATMMFLLVHCRPQ